MHRQLRKREEAEAERGTSNAYYALRQQHITSHRWTPARERERVKFAHAIRRRGREKHTTTTRATTD